MSVGSTGIDETYYPPFPWCSVNVYNLPKTKNVIVKGYIDTGSDGTIVTADIDRKLELRRQPIIFCSSANPCMHGFKLADKLSEPTSITHRIKNITDKGFIKKGDLANA